MMFVPLAMPDGTVTVHGEVQGANAVLIVCVPSLPPVDAAERQEYDVGLLVAENTTWLAACDSVVPLFDGGANCVTDRTGSEIAAWRVTLTTLLSEPAELEQATVMAFEPTARLTVVGLVAAAPFTVQVGAGVPVDVHVTEIDVVVFGTLVPSAGAVIVTTGATGTGLRVTVTDLVSDPAELVQTTVMVFEPSARLTVAGLVAAAPLTVQVFALPVVVQVTEVDVAVVLLPLAGAVIVTTGATTTALRVTVTDLVSDPAELVQTTVMVFEPSARLTVAGLVAAAPLTVQVFALPVVVQVTEVDVAVVLLPLAGAVIVTTGATTTALRVTETDLVSEPAELVQTTVMVFAPSARLTVAGLVAAAPLTVQVFALPVVVQVTEVDVAVVLLPSAGAVMVTTGATTTALRVTVTDLLSVPNALVQATVMVFEPSARLTVAGLVAAAPLTVQVGVLPVVVHVTEVDVAVVLLPLAGAVIVTTGASPRVTVTDLVSVPNALVQTTVMVFAPSARLTVAGLVAAAPLTVQVGVLPVVVHVTEVDVAVVFVPVAGAVIVTTGGVPRLTVMTWLFEPNALVQVTVMVFAPSARLTVAGLVAAAPLTVQLIGVLPVVVHATEVVAAVVLLLLAGELMLTTGAVPRLTVI